MSPDRWEEVKTLFADAMERPSVERARFVAEASSYSTDVRAEVASLIAAADGTDSIPSARRAIASAATQTALQNSLGTQYDIVQSLGHGGMGAVYLARDRALDRFVAIKVLRADLAESSATRERFRREARIAAQLSHPGILPLFTFGEIGGLWYFITRYVRGVTLAERLRVEGRISHDEATRILGELAEALEHAHKSGVVHRDIKPANILLDQDTGRAVLADFGISKLDSETMTQAGAVIGTPNYMSPEQAAESHGVDNRTDIYSLGAVGLEMLGGRHAAVADAGARPLIAVLMRCVERDPAKRWQTATALREALDRIAGVAQGDTAQVHRELPTFAPYALLWYLIWVVIGASPGRPLRDRFLLGITALIVPVGLFVHIWGVSSADWPLKEVARSALRPPEWWGMWWPRRLRQRSDIWPRLPLVPRAVRVVLSVIIVAVPGLILARRWVTATAAPSEWVDTVQSSLVFAAAVTLAFGFAWALYRRVSPKNTVRLVIGATGNSADWMSPEMQRVLLRSDNTIRPANETPAEYQRAIAALAGALPTGQEALRKSYLEVAEQCMGSIGTLDAELSILTREASTSELNRVTAQLAALESLKTEEGRALAELVQQQVEVLRRMQLRIEQLSQERVRVFGTLRGTWRRLQSGSDGNVVESGGTSASLAEANTPTRRSDPSPR